MLGQIVAGLIVAAIAGTAVGFRKQIARLWRRAQPVDISTEVVVGDSWSLAFPSTFPESARAIEGPSRDVRDVYWSLRRHGAVDHGETRLKVRVRSLASETVLIKNIRLSLHKAPPFAGTLVWCPTAGANMATLLVFDLDDDNVAAWEFREDGGRERVGTRPYFDTHNVTLDKGEIHDFIVVATARRSYVEWSLAFDVEVAGHAEVVQVDDSGKPFKTSGDPADGFGVTLDWAWWEGGVFLPTETYDE
jgi:hypothetical protein